MKQKETKVSMLIIAYEFALGLIEITLGLGIAFFGQKVIDAYLALRSSDFINEGHDLLVDALEKIIPYLFTHKAYVVILLIALGLVKIISSIGLWMGKEWGRHLLIGLLVVLIPFDIGGIILHTSLIDASYLVIDVLIILYLVRFQPRRYLEEIKEYLKIS